MVRESCTSINWRRFGRFAMFFHSRVTNKADEMAISSSSLLFFVECSNFACKGYQSDVPGKSHAVATVKAGQQFEVALDGSATHGGGSCQFSLS